MRVSRIKFGRVLSAAAVAAAQEVKWRLKQTGVLVGLQEMVSAPAFRAEVNSTREAGCVEVPWVGVLSVELLAAFKS